MGSSFQPNPAARNDLGTSNFDPRGPSSPASMSASSSSFHQAEPRSFHSLASAQYQTLSPPGRRQSVDKSSELLADRRSAGGMPSILLRKLPTNMSKESLNGMLLFAEDLVDAYFANPTDSADDAAYSCAIARFRTPAAAHEAQRRLHGKPNPSGDATLVVDVLVAEGPSHYGSKSPDPNKQLSTSASSRGSSVNGHSTRQSSRFNSTFQSMGSVSEKLAAMPNGASLEGDYYLPPTSRGGTIGDQRVTGKAMINDDSADDETGELLKDPVAYARNGQISTGRRQSAQQIPLNRMANLTLNTSTANSHPPSQMVSPTNAGFSAGREMHGIQSPASAMSPTAMGSVMVGMNPMSPHSAYPLSPSFPRHQYPPANPADQNPPCNTLYVGNLPIDTSEDELKAMFSKQRGYKRLCFRTKHNGPMCFVEFEDVSFATKALNELYGQPLHNSVKGGIRLSFSKNPLGVRTGQQNSLNSPLSPGGLGLGALGAPPGFSTANGPPPGLAVPPGLSPPIGAGSGMSGFFGPSSAQGTPVGRGSHNYPPSSTSGLNPIGTGYSDVMFGR